MRGGAANAVGQASEGRSSAGQGAGVGCVTAMMSGQILRIQNLVGRSRVWCIDLELIHRRISSTTLLLHGHPDLANPATGVWSGDELFFVAALYPQAFRRVSPAAAARRQWLLAALGERLGRRK